MGKFDDYFNHVDLSTGIPDNFVSDLRAAHEHDLSIPTAKVDSLSNIIAARDASILDLGAEVTRTKAMNFDLLDVPPEGRINHDNTDLLDSDTENGDIDFDDLFIRRE